MDTILFNKFIYHFDTLKYSKDLVEKIKYWCCLNLEQRTHTRDIARQLILSEWSVDYQIQILKSLLK